MRNREDVVRAMSNLTSLRIRELISEEEFAAQRRTLLNEERRVDDHIARAQQGDPWFEPAETVVWFSNRATRWYQHGNDHVRRTIVRAVGSNLVLREKKVSIEAKKPFTLLQKDATCSNLLGVWDDVGTRLETGSLTLY